VENVADFFALAGADEGKLDAVLFLGVILLELARL